MGGGGVQGIPCDCALPKVPINGAIMILNVGLQQDQIPEFKMLPSIHFFIYQGAKKGLEGQGVGVKQSELVKIYNIAKTFFGFDTRNGRYRKKEVFQNRYGI